jgi:hypothetical protein
MTPRSCQMKAIIRIVAECPGLLRCYEKISRLLMHHELSDPSCPAIPDGDFFTLNYNRNFSDASGVRQHLLEFVALFFYVHVLSVFPVCRPGIFCVRSAAFAINDNFFCHTMNLSSKILNYIIRLISYNGPCNYKFFPNMTFL